MDGVQNFRFGVNSILEEGRSRNNQVVQHDKDSGCLNNGTLYAEGSAMDTSSHCEYCYCIKSIQRCVKPQCLLATPECTPVFTDKSCCPTKYNCSHLHLTTTSEATTKVKNKGCIVNNKYYPEGYMIMEDGVSKPCENCYCFHSEVQCEAMICTIPNGTDQYCTPVYTTGHCCPTSYNCSKEDGDETSETRNYNNFVEILTTAGKEDGLLEISESKSHQTSIDINQKDIINENGKAISESNIKNNKTINEEKPLVINNNTKISNEDEKNTTNIKDTVIPTTEKINQNEIVSLKLTTEMTTYLPNNLNMSETMLNISSKDGDADSSTDLSEPEESITDISNSETAVLDSAESDNNTITTMIVDINEINTDLTTISTAVVDETTITPELNYDKVNSSNSTESTSVTNATSDSSDGTNVTLTSENSFAGYDYSKPTTVNSFISHDIEAIINLTKSGENVNKQNSDDYSEYDYSEPSLPPSLPNLKIIPFVAADAVVTKTDDVISPTIQHNQYPQNVVQYPIVHEKPPPLPQAPTQQFPHYSITTEHTQQSPVYYKVSHQNKFSPPTETQGGFIPHEPPILDHPIYYENTNVDTGLKPPLSPVYHSTAGGYNTIDITTPVSSKLQPQEDSVILTELATNLTPPPIQPTQELLRTKEKTCVHNGKRYNNGELMSEPTSLCEVCKCFFGERICQEPECLPLQTGCVRLHDESAGCCGRIICTPSNELDSPTRVIDRIDVGTIPTRTQAPKLPTLLKQTANVSGLPPLQNLPTVTVANLIVTPDPFRDVIKTEPAPDLQLLIGDIIHLWEKTTPNPSFISTDKGDTEINNVKEGITLNNKSDNIDNLQEKNTTNNKLTNKIKNTTLLSNINLQNKTHHNTNKTKIQITTPETSKTTTESIKYTTERIKSGSLITMKPVLSKIKTKLPTTNTSVLKNYSSDSKTKQTDNQDNEYDDNFSLSSMFDLFFNPASEIFTSTTTTTTQKNPFHDNSTTVTDFINYNTTLKSTTTQSNVDTIKRTTVKIKNNLIYPTTLTPIQSSVVNKVNITKNNLNINSNNTNNKMFVSTSKPLLPTTKRKIPIVNTSSILTDLPNDGYPIDVKIDSTDRITGNNSNNNNNKIQNNYDTVVTPSTSSSTSLLKLAGCNIYGRMYRIGRIISELSGPCLECMCTELGVQCRPLPC